MPIMPNAADHRAQEIGVVDQSALAPVPQGDGEEVGGTGDARAAIVDHARRYPGFRFASSRLRLSVARPAPIPTPAASAFGLVESTLLAICDRDVRRANR
jgi:hypothetical protein